MRTRTASSLGLLLIATLVLGEAAAAGSPTVVISDGFEPVEVHVSAGSTVTWRNSDDERHRVRSSGGPTEFDSGNLEPGESFVVRFALEGRYTYVDERPAGDDEGPVGVIVVGAVSPASPTALPDDSHSPGASPSVPATPSPGVSTSPGAFASPGGLAPAVAAAAPVAVDIIDREFAPATMTVAAGTTVEWRNLDDEGHTVSASDGSFDSGLLTGGASFSSTFETPGTYDYSCAIHPEMRGSVTVTPAAAIEASAEPPSPSPDGSPAATASTGVASVTIVSTAYAPAVLEVIAGTTVRWTNEDPIVHTVNARDGSFSSGVMVSGAEYSHRFETPGTYDYFCAIHPGQVGAVVVSEPGG